MVRIGLSVLLCSACASIPNASARLATYDPAAVVITRAEREGALATLRRDGSCLLLDTGGRLPGQRWAPLWPAGTRLEKDQLILPDGQPLPFGKALTITGRFASGREGTAVSGCKARPFLVERANRNFVWADAEGLVRNSDPILVLRLQAAHTTTRGADGFGTTIWAQVLEVLKGDPDYAGEMVTLRLPQTTDGPWPAHDHSRSLRERPAGRRVILFADQEFYAAQARARGGVPLAGALGGTTIYSVEEERIVNDGDSPVPSTLAEVRRLVRAR
jgi:hypothetical protein